MPTAPLSKDESLFYRDRLRSARYAALADAEGFSEICFAVEALGMRLHGKQADLGGYEDEVKELAGKVPARETLAQKFPGCFSRFKALYSTLRKARNDVMHTGAYARHATSAAIELCIHLEEAVMAANPNSGSDKVSDYMVRSVVQIESWQPVAHARQLMLTYSFSFLPVYIDKQWHLLSELAVAKFLLTDRKLRLATSIESARAQGLQLLLSKTVREDEEVDELLRSLVPGQTPTLWLVTNGQVADGKSDPKLLGVLTPFELM